MHDGNAGGGVFVSDECLGTGHAGGVGIYGPGNPSAGFGRSRDEGDGESSVRRVVSEVEVRGERRKVEAVGVNLVFRKLLGGTGEGNRR